MNIAKEKAIKLFIRVNTFILLPTILLMGNESDGLSMFYWELFNKKVKIPIVGEASALNLACATTVFLYEVFSQRHK